METELDTYLSALDGIESYRTVSVLRESRYEKTELVGKDGELFVRKTIAQEGGLGSVYKVLFAEQQQNPNSHPFFFPTIVQCVSTGKDLVVVLEYISGETLDKAIEGSDRIAATDVLFPQICESVAYLHRKGIVHRDIKPTNIMVSGSRIVLIDFGIARVYKSDVSQDTIHLGTRGYAPPEQFGFGQTDAHSDVYALGILLGYCLTGLSPEDLPADKSYKTLLEEMGGSAGNGFRERAGVVDVATRLDPAQRFRDASIMLRAYRTALEQAGMKLHSPVRDEAAASCSQRNGLFEERASLLPPLGNTSPSSTGGAPCDGFQDPARIRLLEESMLPAPKKARTPFLYIGIRNVSLLVTFVLFALVTVECVFNPGEAIISWPIWFRAMVYWGLALVVVLPVLFSLSKKAYLPKWLQRRSFRGKRLRAIALYGGLAWYAVVLMVGMMTGTV